MRLRETVFVLAVLLFCHLAVAFLFRAQPVYAQSSSPITGVDLIHYVVQPGDYLNAGFAIANFPCNDENNDGNCNYEDKFTSVTYRFDVLHRAGQTDADNCEEQGLNRNRTYAPASYNSWRSLGPIPLRVSRSCQPGPYTLHLSVTYFDPATNQSHTLTDTVDFDVGEPPPPTPTPNPNPTPGNGQGGNGQGGNGQGGNGQGGNGRGGQTSRDTQTPEREPSPKPPEPTPEPPPPQGPVAITQPDRTNVRLGPGILYKIVRAVPHGTRAQIICIGPWADW